MKTLIKTKLLEDKYLEIREYELFKNDLKVIHCVSENYKTCYHVGEKYMTLTKAQQKEGKVTNTQQSKFPPYAYYRMYKFLFKPKGINEKESIAGKKFIQVNENTMRIES